MGSAAWRRAGVILLWGALAACAPGVVVLNPGPVAMPEGVSRVEGPAAWSFWVKEARDLRPADKAGQRMGTLYSRFRKEPRAVFLDRTPHTYVMEQLSRYLLHRGLEASGPSGARVMLGVDLEEFLLLEAPGTVLDELTVKVAYTVRFLDRQGQDLGRVRLEGISQVKSPLDGASEVEKALRSALTDTFEALYRTEITQGVLARLSR
ncbi:MAG: hypothetical protein Kow0092_26130 [Deferrisomatales bacterium]